MEKLQQAMEKARRQRALNGTAKAPARGSSAHARPRAEAFIEPEKATPVTFLDATLRANKIVTHLPNGQKAWAGQRRAVDAFRIVRTRALHGLDAEGNKTNTLAVTSPRQGDGKTLVATNLALSLSRQPETKVLLIDGDLRLPGIAKTLGLYCNRGLSDYLAGGATLERCLLAAPGGNLFIIPQVESLAHSSELLANGMLAELMENMRRHHPNWIVVIDCPPILAVDDTLIILRSVDKALLVMREGQTGRAEMRKAAEEIGEDKYLGAVLNDSRTSRGGGQHYYYDYGYEKR